MATYDFSTLDTIVVKKLVWGVITCPVFEPPVWTGPEISAGVPCDIEDSIVKQGTVCYQCNLASSTTITKVQVNGSTVAWAKLTLNFDETGGAAATNKTVYFNRQYGTLPSTSKDYYAFDGWFTASSGGSEVIATTVVNQTIDHTLYAQWKMNPSQPQVSYLGNGQNALYYFVENPNPYAVTLYYEVGDSTPDLNSVSIGANSDEYIDITGLTPNTSYTTYFQFQTTDNNSSVVSQTHTTQIVGASDWAYMEDSQYGDDFPYDSTVKRNHTLFSCPTVATIDTWLTGAYPPSNYAVGHIFRVEVWQKADAGFCGYIWYIAE